MRSIADASPGPIRPRCTRVITNRDQVVAEGTSIGSGVVVRWS